MTDTVDVAADPVTGEIAGPSETQTRHQSNDALRTIYRAIPRYEGKEVTTTKLRVGSTVGKDIDNAVLGVDDVVRVVAEARVIGVAHIVNEKTGDLERVHTVRVDTVDIAPWNDEDDGDEGVVADA